MKRSVLSLLLVAAMMSALAACGYFGSPAIGTTTDNTPNAPANTPADTQNNNSSDNSRNTATPRALQTEAYEITYAKATTWVDILGTVWVQGLVEVTNTGTEPLYLNPGAFDLEDSDGRLVKSVSLVSAFPDVIASGEKAYYYEETVLEIDKAIDLVILPRVSVEKAKVDLIRFDITDLELSDGSFGGGLTARGRIENATDEKHDLIYVAVVLFDGSNTPIGLLFTIIMEDLNPGDRIGFEMSEFSMLRDISVNDVHSYIAYGYPLQWQF